MINSHEETLLGLRGLVEGVPQPLANLANAAALLWQALPDINWVGFYLLDEGALCLGPFMGKPACVRIAPGRGVCGAALAQNETLVVPDVHAFPGHIACDAASQAEIVVPLRLVGRPIGVLDVDSETPGRFTQDDQALLEAVAALLDEACDYTRLRYDIDG